MGDLHHGNINLLILFLIVAMFQAWREGYDGLAGLLLGLAISYKVTPALFIPYFIYKRSWRTVGSTLLGMVLFLLVVPSVIVGPRFNLDCLQHVVAPDADAIPGGGEHQSSGNQPIDGRGAHPLAHRNSSGEQSLRSSSRCEHRLLAAAGRELSRQVLDGDAGGLARGFLPDPSTRSPRSAIPGRDCPGCA